METFAQHFQNLVIGSGEAGKYLAWKLAETGQRTVVVERSAVGGACPNVACLPSKNVIYSAKVASLAARGAEFGTGTGPAKVDMAAVRRRKRRMVEGLGRVHLDHFAASGAEVVMGEARFTGRKAVRVALNAGGTRLLRADRVFLDVGTRARLPDVPGLADAKPMTHVEALDLGRLPEHLVILGGGFIGLEFAQAMRRFGSRVTVVQRGPRLLDRDDPDVADALLQLMTDEGVRVLLNTEVTKVAGRSGEGIRLQARSAAETSTIEASDILVATGRTPNTDTLSAAEGGIELRPDGYVRVDEALRTSAPDVWAMGECAGSPQYTHASFDDFRVVREQLTGGTRTTRNRLIPYCLFTDPELAHVGMTETDAKVAGIPYRLARIPMSAVLRTWTLSETRGFAKALIADDDRVLGFTAFGAEASEMMAVAQTAMLGGMPYTTLRDAIFTHPTIAEGIVVLFAAVPALASKAVNPALPS